MAERLLDVEALQVTFATEEGALRAVDEVSFTLDRGEVVAIVGESGSGKSVTVMTLMGLTRSANARFAGSARLHGLDLVSASEAELEKVRGKEIAMIFQDPIASLSPVHRIGDQIVEQIRAHEQVSRAEAMERAVDLMQRVGIPRARDRARAFPHEFSGGMRQRAMIAMALSLSPGVLIADEPTTALDVTIQAQILKEVAELSREADSGVLFVTHDLGVVADIADRVLVMYGGRIVEQGTLDEIFYDPQHPYTWGLLGSVTRMDRDPPRRLPSIPGQPPSLLSPPAGCHFRPRCPLAFERCTEVPPLEQRLGDAPGHADRCWLQVDQKRRARDLGDGRIGLAIGAGGSAAQSGSAHGTADGGGGGGGGGRGGGSPDADGAAPNGAAGNGHGELLEVEHLQLLFPIKQGVLIDRTVGVVHAVDDVSLTLRAGETLGVVGESGCGKSTLARAMLRLLEPTGGRLRYRGRDITHLRRRALVPVRREVQIVFQDPVASLNPRKRVGQIVGTPMRLSGMDRRQVSGRVRDLLERVGLNPEHVNRFPHEFSGGQRQRIGVARALAVNPQLIVLDEPVSALDVSIQAQVVNLLDDLQDDFGLSYVFIAHDLSVVRHVSDRIAVMYLGKLMEVSPARELYSKPIHPYTDALLAAIPIPEPERNRARERNVIGGEPPNPINPPSGCRFHTRCPRATAVCSQVEPPLAAYANGHVAACHHPLNVSAEEIAAASRSPLSPLSAGELLPAEAAAAAVDGGAEGADGAADDAAGA